MRATIKIVHLYFWKSFYGPFFAFIFPLFFTFIITSIWDLAGEIPTTILLPGCFLTTILTLSLISIPVTINDLRHSILFKRMGASTVQPWKFLVTFGVYYYLIIVVAYCWQVTWTLLIFSRNEHDALSVLTHANYWEILYSGSLSYLLSLFAGLLIISHLKRNYQIQIIAITIIIISIPLAGLGVPIVLIHNHASIVPSTSYVVYADPIWYICALHYESWFAKPDSFANVLGSSIFDPTSELYTKIVAADGYHYLLDPTDKCLNLFIPIILTVCFCLYSVFTFKWNIR